MANCSWEDACQKNRKKKIVFFTINFLFIFFFEAFFFWRGVGDALMDWNMFHFDCYGGKEWVKKKKVGVVICGCKYMHRLASLQSHHLAFVR